ncbi:MAG: NAD(P)-binding protein [Pseudonocardia sp.]|uniref:flavin-containing monooxygenase n=1 Tax=unclassified Pseudonocardia TaxID=2619320 RepID=UPI00086A521D|nr:MULTISPECIES: NAD(P)/FAD-dependent oxidoreductase [unclassified Pseudonocardia]MBN9110383.1 NAD(P)-binding protein [Pseudonocardia sp.]ODV03888.1 MAG: monooxygenase [Pseudonocardia sp. SCN 73-27]
MPDAHRATGPVGLPTVTADDVALRDALVAGNIPTLLLVLRTLTGDPRWFEPPFRPSRTIAMNDNDTGGLPDDIQQEIRDAVLDVLRDLRDGTGVLAPPPLDGELIAMLSESLGEQVPAEYAESMAEDAGFVPSDVFDGPPLGADLTVVIIGAGISGICAGTALRRLGVDVTILERNDDVGGTWLDNDYPGAGVDTPSHLYAFSFAPWASWTRYYAKQPEILDYLRRVADQEGLRSVIRFGTEVLGASWDAASSVWRVRVLSGGVESEIVSDVLVSSVGQLNRPVIPALPGLDTFPGPAFHTAEWDHSVDLAGKRVGVVGTGASAMQVVPTIAEQAGSVVVFQRSPQWVAPNGNYLREVDPRTQLLFEQVPYYRPWYRLRLMWMFQDKLHPTLQRDPSWPDADRSINAINDKHREFFTRYLREQLGDRDDLVAKSLPDYPPYGKRMLLDCDWFSTLRRDDVSLVTSGVAAIDGATVVTDDGGRHDVDVLVFATGFSARKMLHPLDIRGRSGESLRERWGDDDAWAHLGIEIPDFPNLFLMYGPNTNLGHGGSTMFHAECQVHYMVELLREMVAADVAAVEVRQEVCDDYVARVDAAHENMIWTHPGMSTWYRNAAGRVVTNSPWKLLDYWTMTRRPSLDEHLVTPARQSSSKGVA